MEELINEQITDSAQAVETEESVGAAEKEISLGKFKDVSALLNAYNSLQAEFTKRCQRLKELEGKAEVDKRETRPNPAEGDDPTANKGITEEDKTEILKGYLKELLESKQRAVVISGEGVGVKTPKIAPKSFAEAGALAKDILKK